MNKDTVSKRTRSSHKMSNTIASLKRRKFALKPNDEESNLAVAKLALEDFVKRYKQQERNATSEPILAKIPVLSDAKWIEYELHARNLGIELVRQKVEPPENDRTKRSRLDAIVLVRKLGEETTKLV